MRVLVTIFLAAVVLAGCNDKANDKPAQSGSSEAAKRLYDQLGDSADKRIKKDHN